MPNNKKGFTLIELLVVMGILGILMAVTILVINPAEYLKRSRDTQRISDINTVNSALGIYLANEGSVTNYAYCILGVASGTSVTTAAGFLCNTGAVTSVPASVAALRANTGTGWIKNVNFSTMTGGAPFASLPVDPKIDCLSSTGGSVTAGNNCFYVFSSTASVYELAAYNLESAYYASTTTTDGGLNTHAYEVGTSLSLIADD